MRPTLIEGDRIVVERFSRFYSKPKRGDIMVFYPPFEKLPNTPWRVFSRLTGFFCKDVAYIKRVIGTPGDKDVYKRQVLYCMIMTRICWKKYLKKKLIHLQLSA